VDKLGIQPGYRVALVHHAFPLDNDLCRSVQERTDVTASTDEEIDVVLIAVDVASDASSLLREWRTRIRPAGGIWLLTPKRGEPGYINQNDLIVAGQQAGVVDNKTCSISDTVSGMRFVIRRVDRV
jgi:hypothetical protein